MNRNPKEIIGMLIIAFIVIFIIVQLLPLFGILALFLAPFLIIGAVGGWVWQGAKQNNQGGGDQ